MRRVYFNEFDPKAAAWLRQLMADGLIPGGVVDERSITEVQPADLAGFVQCHFFAGIGGWCEALRLAGWGDRPVWSGSCPCQPYSAAGKGEGDADPRNLWPAFFRLIRKCRPQCVFGEQVEGAVGHGWLDGVSADLEGEGYAVGAVVLGAHSVGAPHIRQRLYWVADRQGDGRDEGRRAVEERSGLGDDGPTHRVADAKGSRRRADAGTVRGSTSAWLRGPEGEDERRACQRSRRACDRGPTLGLADADGRLAGDGELQPGREHGQQPEDGGTRERVGHTSRTGLPERVGDGRVQRQAGRPPAGEATELRGHWRDSRLIHCHDGKARRIPKIKSSVLLMADGFYYRMADVYAAFAAEALTEVISYGTRYETGPEEALSLVQGIIDAEAVRQPLGGPGCVHPAEVLLPGMWDELSARHGTTDGRSGPEAGHEGRRRMLRDLRELVRVECASLRREPEEQRGQQPANALLVLSQFLARCGSACRDHEARQDAAAFPLAGKVTGRVGLLRGAGNAIVPAVAAEFVAAFLEV